MRKTKKDILQGINLNEVKKSKVIQNNTLEIEYKNGDRAIRLHNTNIVTFKNNGNIILNSGGWRTYTTKDRINKHLPFDYNIRLYQKNNIWYIGNYNPKQDLFFYDGITLDNKGNLIGKPKKDNTKQIKKIKKDIKNYVNLIDKLDKLPIPNGGDCWYCLFREKETGKTWGDINNSDHLKEHIKEGYMFGSILINSMKEYGYRDMQIGIHYQMNWRDTFKRALKKYLYKRLLK